MNKISCNVINDLLPLYADEVVSEDTMTIVEEHLTGCEACKEKYEQMKREIGLNEGLKAIEAEKQAILEAKRKIRKKRIITSVVSGIVIGAIIFAAVFLLNYIKISQKYETERFEVSIREQDGVDCLYLDYTGKMNGYEQIEYYDGEKLIHYVEVYTTPWGNIFGNDNDKTKHEIMLTTIGRSDSTPIDEIRYIDDDLGQLYEPLRDYGKLTDSSILLWERKDGLQYGAESVKGEKRTK